ncbi:MAG: hypothetical protein EOO25_15920, partial [Comamonadaceae bacterium]
INTPQEPAPVAITPPAMAPAAPAMEVLPAAPPPSARRPARQRVWLRVRPRARARSPCAQAQERL